MANKFFGAISHIGGSDGDLDKISKDIISDGDAAFVVDATNNTIDFYTLDSSNATAEDGTNFTVITPDDEAASPGKRWIKVAVASWDGSAAERGTVVTLDATQTLTNKSLTAAALTGATTVGAGATLTSPIINTILAKAGENGIVINADGATELYHDNVKTVYTAGTGAIFSNGTQVGTVGWEDAATLRLKSIVDSAIVELQGLDSGSNDTILLAGDPDGSIDLYYDGVKTASTTATGIDTAMANEWTYRQNANEGTLTDGATINWDLSASQKQVVSVTLGGNRTMAAPTNNAAGATYILRVVQDGTGGRTLSWNAEFLWGPDGAPALSPNAADVDVFVFYDDGTSLHGRRFYNEA